MGTKRCQPQSRINEKKAKTHYWQRRTPKAGSILKIKGNCGLGLISCHVPYIFFNKYITDDWNININGLETRILILTFWPNQSSNIPDFTNLVITNILLVFATNLWYFSQQFVLYTETCSSFILSSDVYPCFFRRKNLVMFLNLTNRLSHLVIICDCK